MFFRINPRLLEGNTYKRQSQGLLEPANPAPGVADVVAHADATTVEVQVVRVVAAPRVSTRRPIVAVVANAEQLTRVVVTQGGQVKVFACVSSGRKAGGGDTTAGVLVEHGCCT